MRMGGCNSMQFNGAPTEKLHQCRSSISNDKNLPRNPNST